METKKSYELHYLSAEFYNKYNSVDYPEIEQKIQRPYIVLLIKVDDNTFALPLRTNIKHSSCYTFSYSSRPTDSVTGIDFSKAVIVNESRYIGETAEIDNKEYVELNDRIAFIISKFSTYIRGYYSYVSGKANEYQARKYSKFNL